AKAARGRPPQERSLRAAAANCSGRPRPLPSARLRRSRGFRPTAGGAAPQPWRPRRSAPATTPGAAGLSTVPFAPPVHILRRAQRAPRSAVAKLPARAHFEHAVRDGERREVREVISARKTLREEGGGGAGQRTQSRRDEEAPESVQCERHPLARQHLDVRELI